MSSTQRAFAQRNNNVTTLIPVLDSSSNGTFTYRLDLPSYYVGGIYIVDLAGNDSNKNPIDGSGIISVEGGIGSAFPGRVNTVTFVVNTPLIPPSVYPGAEFTIFFKNYPANVESFFGPPLFTIGISSGIYEGFLPPYIFSPPLPVLFTNDGFQSITLKSEGKNSFSVVASGPAGWLGVAALLSLLSTPFGQNERTTIVPDASGAIDISYSTITNAFIYPITLPTLPFIGGQYIVDLSENGLDAYGHTTIPLNGTGVVRANLGGYDGSANVIMFNIIIPDASYNYIGNEFTLVFKNVPHDTTRTYGGEPFLTIGITDNAVFGNSNIWYFSSPTPVIGPPNNVAHTLTFKYDGTTFNVVSSGPAGWLSLPLLRQLLAAVSP